MRRPLFVVLSLLSGGMGLAANQGTGDPAGTQIAQRRVMVTERWQGPAPRIDGVLDDPGWQEGAWVGEFVQREPMEGGSPSLDTRVKVRYDDKNLYIAFRCYDPEIKTRRRVLAAPDEFAGDMVGVALDTYFNRRTAFEFNVTSGGSKVDTVLGNFGPPDTSWRAVWEVKVGQEVDAWVAEYRIPLSQLRFAPSHRQVWGMHLWRWIDAKQEEDQFSLIPIDHPGIVRSFGELHGIEGLAKSRRLELVPYGVISYQTHAPDLENPLARRRESKWNAGLDAKYGLSSGLTLDATINPDFGQVEADPSEINLSTVETFLKEQRPFFLEGKSVFDFKIDEDIAFYSRRIGAAPPLETPDAAFAVRPATSRVLASAKVTGRTEQGLTLGALVATTDRTYAQVSDGAKTERALINPLTHFYATRLQQDLVDGDVLIGGLLAGVVRAGSDSDLRVLPRRALTAGVEGIRYWDGHSYFVEGRFLLTRLDGSAEAISEKMQEWVHNYQRTDAARLSVDPKATHLSGHAGSVRLGKDNAGAWRYQASLTWKTPGFDINDIGYLGQADALSPAVRLDYFTAESGKYLRRRIHSLRLRENRDYAGMLNGRSVVLQNELATHGSNYYWNQVGVRFARTDPRILRGGPALRLADSANIGLHFNGNESKRWAPKAWLEWNRSLETSSHYFTIEPSVTYRPAPNTSFQFGLEYTFNRQNHQYAASTDFGSTLGWILGRMRQETVSSTVRMTHNFSPALTLTYFAGPYITSGRFRDFKRVIAPRASAINDRYAHLSPQLDAAADSYHGASNDGNYTFDNPDFTWRELKSNLVLRWEYRPGSFLYCVWTQQRSDGSEDLEFRPLDEHRRLFSSRPENVFLIKASYWFSI